MTVQIGSVTNNGSATSFLHTCTSNSDRLLIVSVVWYHGGNDELTSLTYDGVEMEDFYYGYTNGNTAALLYLRNPASGANTLTATFSPTPSEGPVIIAMDLYGVDQTSPIADDDNDTSYGADTSVSMTLSGVVGGLDVATIYSWQDDSISSGAGQTRQGTHTYNQDTGALDTKPSTVAPNTISFSGADYPAAVALSIAPSAGGGGSSFIPVAMQSYRNLRS